MTGVYIMLGGMVLFAAFFALVDLLDERRHRQPPASPPQQP